MLLDVCECVLNSEDLEQSSTVDICVGTSVNPCICNDTNCMVSRMYVVKFTYASSYVCHHSAMKKVMLVMIYCVQEIVTVITSQMLN